MVDHVRVKYKLTVVQSEKGVRFSLENQRTKL